MQLLTIQTKPKGAYSLQNMMKRAIHDKKDSTDSPTLKICDLSCNHQTLQCDCQGGRLGGKVDIGSGIGVEIL